MRRDRSRDGGPAVACRARAQVAQVFADLHRRHGVDLRLVGLRDPVAAAQLTWSSWVLVLHPRHRCEDAGLGSRERRARRYPVLAHFHHRDVFAIGDIANSGSSTPLKRRLRVEHWDNAIKQGRVAAHNLLGQDWSLMTGSRTSSPISTTSAWSTSVTSDPRAMTRVEIEAVTQLGEALSRAYYTGRRPGRGSDAGQRLGRVRRDSRAMSASRTRKPSETTQWNELSGRMGAAPPMGCATPQGSVRSTYFTSNRSRFITLTQAATKSWTNLSWASSLAYTSASARSWECDPNTRSTAVAVHRGSPETRSRPS